MTGFKNENELLKALQAQDRQAFRALYIEYYEMIRHFVRKNSGTDDDAADLFQETLLVLVEKVCQPDFQLTAKLKTFLYSIARNKWLRELRKRGKGSVVDVSEYENIAAEPENEPLNQRQSIILKKCLNLLSDACRELLKRFYFYRHSMEELAEDLGYANTNTVKTQKYKCLQRLKKLAKTAEGTV